MFALSLVLAAIVIVGLVRLVEAVERWRAGTPDVERRWRLAEVAGLWAAAIVGTTAIIVGALDSASQRDVLQSEARPWVYPKIEIGGPLTWLPNGNGLLRLSVTLTNTGHAVVGGTALAFEVHAVRSADAASKIADEMRICDAARRQALSGKLGGQSLFPNETKTGRASGSVAQAELANAWPNPQNVTLELVGCVDYSFASDPAGFGQTGFSYIIRGSGGDIDPGTGDVAAADLAIETDLLHGNYMR